MPRVPALRVKADRLPTAADVIDRVLDKGDRVSHRPSHRGAAACLGLQMRGSTNWPTRNWVTWRPFPPCSSTVRH